MENYPKNISKKGFDIQLYLDHIEEAGFLYQQKQILYDDVEIKWTDLADWEKRIEPHLDALVIGETLALEVCKKEMQTCDYDQLYPIVCVYVRQNKREYFYSLIKTLDPTDDQAVKTISDALIDENAIIWHDMLVEMLEEEDLQYHKVIVPVVDYLRWKVSTKLFPLLETTKDLNLKISIIHALGKIRESESIPILKDIFEASEDESILEVAYLSSSRLGDFRWLSSAMEFLKQGKHLFLLPLVLSNQDYIHKTLHTYLYSQKERSKDILIALGLLGNIESLSFLLPILEDEELSEWAALALHLITGANLYEEYFFPEDEEDEDSEEEEELDEEEEEEDDDDDDVEELDEEEEEYGEYKVLLSEEIEDWQTWIQENIQNFDSSIRYRIGKPYSQSTLIEQFANPNMPHFIRKIVHDELFIHHQMYDLPEPNRFVILQQRFLQSFKDTSENYKQLKLMSIKNIS